MNEMNNLFSIIISTIISFFVGLFLDAFLPEKLRVKLQLKKKKFSKWLKNPSYIIGISSRIDLKQNIELEKFEISLKKLFASKNPTIRGSEILLRNSQSEYDVSIMLQPAYEECKDEKLGKVLQVYSLNITTESKVKYRDLRNQIDDLLAILDDIKKMIIRYFNAYPAKRILYIEIGHLEEFSEILENLKARQIEGFVKDTNTKFVYYNNRLTIENTINSKTIQWFIDIIAYVG